MQWYRPDIVERDIAEKRVAAQVESLEVGRLHTHAHDQLALSAILKGRFLTKLSDRRDSDGGAQGHSLLCSLSNCSVGAYSTVQVPSLDSTKKTSPSAASSGTSLKD